MTVLRTETLANVPAGIAPGYTPSDHKVGILHIGLGAFHRAHQAVYTDGALAEAGGDWRIAAVSLRSTDTVDVLTRQDNLFTVIESGAEGTRPRIIGSLGQTIAAVRNRDTVPSLLADPAIRIVTLTVTEKAYGLDRANLDCDPAHPAVARDLSDPRRPEGVLGLLVEGLRRRREAGHSLPAILCCDNLPENGALLRAGVIGFARRVEPDLAVWIEMNAAFPSSMVDRITPAADESTLAKAAELTGLIDNAAIEAEPFIQWVIEDNFPMGRPAWDKAGAIFVADVTPYETMKLRMLNGAHSLIAYCSVPAGLEFVRDAMAEPALVALANRQMKAAAITVGALDNIDLDTYRTDLLARFSNSAIAHRTTQIAMDGTEKLPQRIFSPAVEALASGGDIDPFAFATAAWMRYCLGRSEAGESHDLNDPREQDLRDAIKPGAAPQEICDALMHLPGLFPDTLRTGPFREAVIARLGRIMENGMVAAARLEAQ